MPEERVSLQVAISSEKAVKGASEVVGATNRIKQGAKTADTSVENLERRFISLRGAARALIGPVGAIVGTLSAARGISAAVQVISDFETTLATLRGVARASAEEIEALEDSARQFGATTRFSATQAGEGLIFLARAGFSAQESMDALGATLNLAAAGNIALGEAADYASNIVSQFGLSADETVRVVDDLVIVSNRANTNVQQLAQALSFAGPVAAALGIDIEETSAAIGSLGDVGIQSTRAGRGLRGVLLALAAPTTEAQKIFEKLNIDIKSLDPSTQSLTSLLQKLEAANLDAGDAAKIFGRENVASAIALTGTTEKTNALIQAQKEMRGEAQELADIQADTLVGATKSLISALSELALQAGDSGVAGAMRLTVDTSTDFVKALAGVEAEGEEASTTMKILAVQAEAAAIALTLFASARIATNLFVMAKNADLLRKAMVGINVAIARNPLTLLATAATFAIVEISGIIDVLSDTGDEVNKLRDDVFDFKNAIDQLEGLEGVVNRAFAVGEPELVKRAFNNVRNVLIQEAERLSQTAAENKVNLSDIIDIVPDTLQDRLGTDASAIIQLAVDKRKSDIAEIEKTLDDLFTEKSFTDGNETNAIFQINNEIAETQKLLEEVRKAPIDTALISRTDALDFIEKQIAAVNNAIEEQQVLAEKAESSKYTLGIDPEVLLRTTNQVNELRNELERSISLAGKSDNEIQQAENAYRALAVAANLPLMQRLAFMGEIVAKTKELQAVQRGVSASDYIRAEQESLDVLRLRADSRVVEAELLQRELNLRSQGIDLTNEERATLSALIEERISLQKISKDTSVTSNVDGLFRELELERELIGLTNDERERAIKLRQLEAAAAAEQVPNIEGLVEQYKNELEELQKLRELEQLGTDIGNSIGGALEDIIFNAQSAEEAFAALYKQVAQLFFRQFVTTQISSFLGSSFPNIFGGGVNADGGVYMGGWQTRMARGDILTGPTVLKAANGPALGGEAGPEAVMPLARDSQGRLGVRQSGRGSASASPTQITMIFPNVTDATGFELSARQQEQRLARRIREQGG